MITAVDYAELIAVPSSEDVPGWFYPADALLLRAVDELQGAHGIGGDVLEIGVYHGKSAILLGCFPRAGERFAVCDIFGDAAGVSEENRVECSTYYEGHEQAAFERNYLRFHDDLPLVLAMSAAGLGDVLAESAFRLVHVDGSHACSEVRRDIATARRLLGPGGVLVLDDWSTSHAPGVAVALWEAYAAGDLIPLAFTPGKFYATWDPDGLTAAAFAAWAEDQPDLETTYEHSLGRYAARHFTMGASFWRRFTQHGAHSWPVTR